MQIQITVTELFNDKNICPITSLNFSNDKPHTYQADKAKRDWRKKTYQPKKVKNETTATS